MEEGLVSVITPMYNAEKLIAKTIESVQAQTYQNWEMVIVDDVSTDGGSKIVGEYAQADSRIRYLRHESNQGVSKTRNTALQNARGQYVAFLDSDDLWKPDKLEKQLAFMKEQGASFCYCACRVIGQDGQSAGKTRYVPPSRNYGELLKGNVIPCLTVVLDRKQIQNIHMPDMPHEDYGAWLDILKTGITAYGLNEVLAEYRVSGGSVSGNKLAAAKWTWDIYRRQQGLGIVKSCLCFGHYVVGAVRKRY